MLIGLISDTHDHIQNAKEAAAHFREKGVKMVLHAGDFCSPFMVPIFEEFDLHAVFGNNDGDTYRLMQKMDEIGGQFYDQFFNYEFDGGLKLAMYHGTHQQITDALIASGHYDIVVSGHTHQVVEENHNGVLHINPGSANGFHHQATVGIFDTDTKMLNIETLN